MTDPIDDVDCVVAGAGVVGLAVARALALAGRQVLLLEAADAIGTATSARNSEVIHAGLYYAPGSLKARLCVRGRQQLYAYCEARGLPHGRCGKLVVATSPEQEATLARMAEQARTNGVDDLQLLRSAQARALEPALRCSAALLSPSTGIIDSHSLMLALLGDLEHAGGQLALHATLAQVEPEAQGLRLTVQDPTGTPTQLRARTLVNATGLWAPLLAARIQGLAPGHVPRAHYAKGSYFTLLGRAPFARLIYPAPQDAWLGVHLTLDLGGQAKFGPDLQWLDITHPEQADYRVEPARAQSFYAEVRRYWPGLPDGALQPAYSGLRPKIHGQDEPAPDFRIDGPALHGVAGLVNLFGIESPGLTSALAIGEHVVQMLQYG